MGREISVHVQKKLYAESMGRCMNPDCEEVLFKNNGDIIERAHIRAFCETSDNSFDNLIVLCPNCHTNFDKNSAFSLDQVKMWKQIRRQKVDEIFGKRFENFDDLSKKIVPLLLENKNIYENYYPSECKELWNKFEPRILVNNGMIKEILKNNFHLIQKSATKDYSNLELVHLFLTHIDEFESTRPDKEKNRHVLFPVKINSMFGISPVKDFVLPSVESLEALIAQLEKEDKFISLSIGNDELYIELKEDGKCFKIFLDDSTRLRQFYYNYNCFRATTVRLENLNFVLKYMNDRKVKFEFLKYNNLREVLVHNVKIIFIYEYCLSKVSLMQLSLEAKSVIVNLHNWNGSSSISKEADNFSKTIDVTLLTVKDFYVFIKKFEHIS